MKHGEIISEMKAWRKDEAAYYHFKVVTTWSNAEQSFETTVHEFDEQGNAIESHIANAVLNDAQFDMVECRRQYPDAQMMQAFAKHQHNQVVTRLVG